MMMTTRRTVIVTTMTRTAMVMTMMMTMVRMMKMRTARKLKERRRIWERNTLLGQSDVLRMRKMPVILNQKKMVRGMSLKKRMRMTTTMMVLLVVERLKPL
ncbi:unnamed protein product [Coffea canephora]|uniref:Uncharacterized protein n=1 Tax=Coffea canephora TaxID=49390 RepID=A0A068TRV4_COFCA|nr:unnamed protein product [Coffea canephora]